MTAAGRRFGTNTNMNAGIDNAPMYSVQSFVPLSPRLHSIESGGGMLASLRRVVMIPTEKKVQTAAIELEDKDWNQLVV